MEILEAYCLKTKRKEIMVEAEVVMTKKGGYMCKGTDKDGNKMCLIMGKATAEEVINKGLAKKGY